MPPNKQSNAQSNIKSNTSLSLIIGGLILFIFGAPILGTLTRAIFNAFLQNPASGTSGKAVVNIASLVAMALAVVGGPLLVLVGLMRRRKAKR